MQKFRVVVWCDACRGQDDEGCFHGGTEIIGSAFASRDTADKAGEEYCAGLPYRFRVEEEELEFA